MINIRVKSMLWTELIVLLCLLCLQWKIQVLKWIEHQFWVNLLVMILQVINLILFQVHVNDVIISLLFQVSLHFQIHSQNSNYQLIQNILHYNRYNYYNCNHYNSYFHPHLQIFSLFIKFISLLQDLLLQLLQFLQIQRNQLL